MSEPRQIELSDDDVAASYALHVAGGPRNVLLTIIFKKDETYRAGIFSSFAASKEWLAEREREDDYDGDAGDFSITAPFIIDEPEWGNTPEKEKH